MTSPHIIRFAPGDNVVVAVRAVYEYAEPIKQKGFVFMDTSGYNPVGATGQGAGGCNAMCFTTDRRGDVARSVHV